MCSVHLHHPTVLDPFVSMYSSCPFLMCRVFTRRRSRADFALSIMLSTVCRFFIEIASDCETLDTSNHSLSFISDANVVALHRLLWINQEKIGDYLSSSRDHKAVGRRPFDKMAMLLAYLGPPEHRPLDSQ